VLITYNVYYYNLVCYNFQYNMLKLNSYSVSLSLYSDQEPNKFS